MIGNVIYKSLYKIKYQWGTCALRTTSDTACKNVYVKLEQKCDL